MSSQIIFSSFEAGSLKLDNRIVMAPMTRCFSPNGVPGPDVAAYYRRRAEGGVGLIVTEGTWINHSAASNEKNVPRFYGEDALEGWRRVVREVHAAGGKIVPQLWHTGLTYRPDSTNVYEKIEEDLSYKVSPSGYVMPGQKVGEGMTDDEILALIDAYAEGAETAEALGFDGVEIHGAHGYMVDQFLWAETNKRTDRWGGSLENRTRFACEILRACRARVSDTFPIILRFSQWKLQEYSAKLAATPEELERILIPLSEAGVDIFHASTRRFWQPEFEGSDLNLAGWIKKITGKPTITVGSIGLDKDLTETATANPDDLNAAVGVDGVCDGLERGEYDLIAVGRALIADPDWPHKIRRGSINDIAPYGVAALATLT
jgi:2,4-dienoyl-CoA reductase-like NADH-dependent reductase (Old Yellow Enzyme family)